ncbi:MAG: glucosidase, partial [Chloroflexia bacterium]|nr:glucosidase [Chloroflexia bacterium]
MDHEKERLEEARSGRPWRKWGPYLSERQWGTVREDYSEDGNAWAYFAHDQARSRAYAWGEDGLAGLSDDQCRLCFALALWNGNDPILKERLFGLTNAEGNHGEDVKEYYYYLDSTPTHSYMRYLYKYPQAAFPYEDLVETNQKRGRDEQEYELIDTGIFDKQGYFDFFVTYAKVTPEDLLIEIEVINRGTEAAELHILPHLWFRNTWSWGKQNTERPQLSAPDATTIQADHSTLGEYRLYCGAAPDGTSPTLLFTDNETNCERIFGSPNRTPFVKDGINNYLVHGAADAVNPEQVGTKAAVHYHLTLGAGARDVVRLRLRHTSAAETRSGVGEDFDALLNIRQQEADAFYATLAPSALDADGRLIMRQALAGMLWSKQFFYYDIADWLKGYGADPATPSPKRSVTRNRSWFHMVNADIISMPDKWEYPWYAAWDLAFHCIALHIVDPDFAKHQLELMLSPNYLHPNGQIPAYEWNFGDVNPPVHAWAVFFIYQIEKETTGNGDLAFLQRCFPLLTTNFTWWVNRKDRFGTNVFEGGFLGLDNIGVFDRSSPLPTGGHLEQADGTAWMAFFSQMMLRIALELVPVDPSAEGMAIKFFEHFLWIVYAMDRVGEHADELWDKDDGFSYDVLRLPDGTATRLKVRSMVGLLALAASAVVPLELLQPLDNLQARVNFLSKERPELTANVPSLKDPGV